MGAITELHWVNNYSGSALTITNLEPDPVFAATCPPGRSTFISEQWVPWCSRGSDFAAHHIVIIVNGVTFFMWQDTDSDGNWVRLSTAGYTSSSIPSGVLLGTRAQRVGFRGGLGLWQHHGCS